MKEELISYFYSLPSEKKNLSYFFTFKNLGIAYASCPFSYIFYTPCGLASMPEGHKGPPTPHPFSSFYPPVCKSTLPAAPVV